MVRAAVQESLRFWTTLRCPASELVVRLDRLGCSIRDVLNLVHDLKVRGAALTVLEPTFSIKDAAGPILVTVLEQLCCNNGFCQGSRHSPWPTRARLGIGPLLTEGWTKMRCLECGSEAVTERPERTAQAFFRSAQAVTGVTPDRVTTDGHDSYPRAIRTELGKCVRHRCSRYLNNRLEQDHRGIKGRYRPMRGFKCPQSAARFCRAYDELHNFLRLRSRHYQHVPADRLRLLHLRRTVTVLAILEAA